MEWLKPKMVKDLHWQGQSGDLNPTENLQHCLNTAVDNQHPTITKNMAQTCQEERLKFSPKQLYPTDLQLWSQPKGGSSKSEGGEYLCKKPF